MRGRFLAPVLGAVVFAGLSTFALAADAPVLSVELTLEPAEPAGTYTATLLVSDSASGEPLSAPRLHFRAGDPARASSRTPAGDLVELEVAVASDGSEASYEVQLVRDDEPLTLHKGKVRLGRGEPAVGAGGAG